MRQGSPRKSKSTASHSGLSETPIDLQTLLAESSPEERAELRRLGREQCWRDGNLRWKLDSNQQGLYDEIQANKRKRFVLECARRLGKSYLLCLMAVEVCLQKPRARVVYGAPTNKEAASIIVPIIEDICADAPEEVKPRFNGQTGHFEFPNGAAIVLFGCDDKRKANRGRGPGADFVVIDEAGFISILGYVLHSIVNPQTLTTGGRVLIASTPSDEPDHDFTKIAEQAEADGNFAHRVITDNPRLTEEQIAEYVENEAQNLGMTIEEYKKSDSYQREHLALRVVDRTLVVMGDDWLGARESSLVELERPEFFDAYESLDMGGVDPHAVLFGYWDFVRGWLVIEDELLMRDGENTEQIAELVQAKEKALWGVSGWDGTLRAIHEEKQDKLFLDALPHWARAKLEASVKAPLQPYLRVCDHDFEIANELSQLHGITYLPTEKTEKRWHVNELRILIRQSRLKVNPRCRHLDRHLKQTVWANHRQSDYKRKNGEHGDLVDCLNYMARNIRKNRNPVPAGWGNDGENMARRHIRPAANPLTKLVGLPKRK